MTVVGVEVLRRPRERAVAPRSEVVLGGRRRAVRVLLRAARAARRPGRLGRRFYLWGAWWIRCPVPSCAVLWGAWCLVDTQSCGVLGEYAVLWGAWCHLNQPGAHAASRAGA